MIISNKRTKQKLITDYTIKTPRTIYISKMHIFHDKILYKLDKTWINRCLICKRDLGDMNPRQYCEKTFCAYEDFIFTT
jgi:hypothetical protein